MEALVKQIFEGPYYEWLNADPHPTDPELRTYKYIDDSIKRIADHVASHGPYDGFIGFSQGGSVCHLLALMASAGTLPFAPPRFVMIWSARITRHGPHQPMVQAALDSPLELPALVIWNGWDDHVGPEETEAPLMTLADPTAIKLDQIRGHKIARFDEATCSRVRAFLEAIPFTRRDACTVIGQAAASCLRGIVGEEGPAGAPSTTSSLKNEAPKPVPRWKKADAGDDGGGLWG